MEEEGFNQEADNKEENKDIKIKENIDENIAIVKKVLSNCDDVVYREFLTGGSFGVRCFLFYIDGMADKMLIDSFVCNPLMLISRIVPEGLVSHGEDYFDAIKQKNMVVADYKEKDNIDELIHLVLTGETGLIVDGVPKGIMIASKLFPTRGVGEPSNETVIRGPRDSFTEVFRFNTALLRRRIRDTRFKITQRQIGERSKTDIAVCYINGIADEELIEDVNKKLDEINIDAVLDSGYIEQFLEESDFCIFPRIQATERPDVLAGAIYEGRIGIIVDNSPHALILPVNFISFFQSPEDYYAKSVVSSFVRFIRIFACATSLTAPALYIAITSFNPNIIPSKLVLSIAASREGVPFPAFFEAAILELTFELLREAGVRLPKPIGSTIGIVGGVVIGQAAVAANLVSPIMVIVVAVTAISSFAIPNYEVSAAFRLFRFCLMAAAAIMGLYGVVLGLIVLAVYMVNIKSFGVPYLSPLAPLSMADIKDSAVRAPWRWMKERPQFLNPGDRKRQGGE